MAAHMLVAIQIRPILDKKQTTNGLCVWGYYLLAVFIPKKVMEAKNSTKYL